MEFVPIFSTFFIVLSTLVSDSACLTVTASINPSGLLTIGNNVFNLTCVIDSQGADLFGIDLERKRESDPDYIPIVSFPGPTFNRSVSYLEASLESRTTAVKPTSSSPPMATLTFQNIVCTDKAMYKWTVGYYDTQQRTATVITEILTLKALSTFRDDGQISYSPNSSLQEGTEVVFSCVGNVGNTPIGQLVWYLYKNNATSGGAMLNQSITVNPPTAEAGNACSYRRSSSLRLTMTYDLDGAVVRCTTQQDDRTEFGDNKDNYKQTEKLSVMYSPKNPVIKSEPRNPSNTYEENLELLKMMCSAISKPEPSYYWIVPASEPNGTDTIVNGPVLQLRNLTVNDTGVYMCVVQNTINGQNYSVNTSVSITVQKVTTTTTTTTPSTTSGATTPSGGGGNTGKQTDDDKSDTSTTVIIVVCVLGGVLVIVIIVIIVVIKMRKNKKEPIEEPPEKPVRNNQDLSYFSNRPDLVSADHGMKNNTLNASFNNSFDSTSDIKSRNEDGLNYVDLAFDDKPRSRRPIQIVDNGHMPYADIAMPHV